MIVSSRLVRDQHFMGWKSVEHTICLRAILREPWFSVLRFRVLRQHGSLHIQPAQSLIAALFADREIVWRYIIFGHRPTPRLSHQMALRFIPREISYVCVPHVMMIYMVEFL
jgi:hypothetical protein